MGDPLREIVDADLCAGCGLCAGLFPQQVGMALNGEGYLRPVAKRGLDAKEGKLLTRVCPGAGLAHPSRGAEFHPLWGPILRCQTGYACDPATRFAGSSGGALSALACFLVETGKVDGVLHVVPSETDPFACSTQISRSREEILRGAGSRYTPASPLERLDQCLAQPGKLAFIGKPCDVAALRALSRERQDVRGKFPYLLSFMCAGTPSVRGSEAVVRKLGFDPQQVVRFRYRGNGWPGRARAETHDGRSAEMDYEASWGTILNRYLQFRCKICADGTGEFSDVTCADAWYGNDKGYPTFSEQAGRSLVLSRTEVGKELVGEAVMKGYLSVETLPVEDLEGIQPYQAQRKRVMAARLMGMALAVRRIPAYRNLAVIKAGLEAGLVTAIRNAGGTWARVVRRTRRGR